MTRHVDYRRMAADIFRQAAMKTIGVAISREAFENSSPSVTLTSPEKGKHAAEIMISTHAVHICARVWLVEVENFVHASACVTEYLDKVEKRNRTPAIAFAHSWLVVSHYSTECTDCN